MVYWLRRHFGTDQLFFKINFSSSLVLLINIRNFCSMIITRCESAWKIQKLLTDHFLIHSKHLSTFQYISISFITIQCLSKPYFINFHFVFVCMNDLEFKKIYTNNMMCPMFIKHLYNSIETENQIEVNLKMKRVYPSVALNT